MDESIDRMRDGLGLSFQNLARNFSHLGLLNKLALIICSAALTMLHFVDEKWAMYSAFAIIPVLVLASISLLFIEFDAPEILNNADEAIKKAKEKDLSLDKRERELDENYSLIQNYEAEQSRVVQLYFSMSDMREAMETLLAGPNPDAISLIRGMLAANPRVLRLACGFELSHHFSIAVYFSDPTLNGHLRCIAQDRSVVCSLEDARIWPSGVGVSGACHANGVEVIIPDLLDPAFMSAYKVPQSLEKSGDSMRHRSLAAVPIKVTGHVRPWGVVIGTSNRAGHFHAQDADDNGPQAAEAIRAIAGMASLAVKCCDLPQGLRDSGVIG